MASFGSFDAMANFMSVLFPIFFVVVLGLIVFSMVRGAAQWKRNNDSPVLTVWARVANQRQDVSHHHHNTGVNDTSMMTSSSTRYFVTFEVESGSRMELSVSGKEYGYLAIGDSGSLTFQGTRYLGFEREDSSNA